MTTTPRNAEALARALREPTASDDDLARIEQGLVRGLEARRAAPSAAPRFVLGALGLAAIAAAVLFVGLHRSPPPTIAGGPPPVAPAPSLPLPPPSATLAPGDELASGAARLGHATLSVDEGSLLHVDDDALAHAVVTLARGRVHVAFHPVHRGEEHLAVVTDLARIEVVGTEFVVTRSEAGTDVAVEEGVVQVTVLAGGEVQELRAGDVVSVPHALPSVAPPSSPAPIVHAPAPSAIVVALPSLDEAVRAADAGDRAPLERLATEGSRSERLGALFELESAAARAHDRAAQREALERTIALDPTGEDGARALYEHALLATDAATTAAELARYLDGFPDGAFAAQARQRLCATDPSRCVAP